MRVQEVGAGWARGGCWVGKWVLCGHGVGAVGERWVLGVCKWVLGVCKKWVPCLCWWVL